MYFRQPHGLLEQPEEQVTSRHSSDGDSVRAALTSTNSALESRLGRDGSSSAENELADSESVVGPTNISGRRSNMHRNERYLLLAVVQICLICLKKLCIILTHHSLSLRQSISVIGIDLMFIPSVGLCVSVSLSGTCTVAKRLIGSSCRLGW